MKISVDFEGSGDLLLLFSATLVTKFVSPQITISLDNNPVDNITLQTSVNNSTTRMLKNVSQGNHVLTIESDIDCVYVVEKLGVREVQ